MRGLVLQAVHAGRSGNVGVPDVLSPGLPGAGAEGGIRYPVRQPLPASEQGLRAGRSDVSVAQKNVSAPFSGGEGLKNRVLVAVV